MSCLLKSGNEYDRVNSLIMDTLGLLCKTGLPFTKQLKLQGVLAVTIDDNEIFLVNINEDINAENTSSNDFFFESLDSNDPVNNKELYNENFERNNDTVEKNENQTEDRSYNDLPFDNFTEPTKVSENHSFNNNNNKKSNQQEKILTKNANSDIAGLNIIEPCSENNVSIPKYPSQCSSTNFNNDPLAHSSDKDVKLEIISIQSDDKLDERKSPNTTMSFEQSTQHSVFPHNSNFKSNIDEFNFIPKQKKNQDQITMDNSFSFQSYSYAYQVCINVSTS